MTDHHPDEITEQRKVRLVAGAIIFNPIVRYFRCEVEPHVPDAWIDRDKIRAAYKINFNRHFYKHTPQHSLAKIDANLKQMEGNLSVC
ncbi:MAG: hypothetical protein J4F42_02375 [Desulfurellaceae bacterium]|nr:hypothetical protein [Desulfurellaceae bacterium]